MNTLEITALESTAVQPVNQAAADFAEFQKLHQEAFDLEHNTLRKLKEKESAARAKWAETVVQAVLCAEVFSEKSGDLWAAFGEAVTDNLNASATVEGLVSLVSGSDEEDINIAFSLGMVAGMMYSALTGMTVTPPALPVETEDTPEAVQVA